MGLNPGENILDCCFNGGSPYFDMYRCGYYGIPFDYCIEKCKRNGIAIRPKDIRSYNDGCFRGNMGQIVREGETISMFEMEHGVPFSNMKLSDFPLLPPGWIGTERRFFPCTSNNKPMRPWGWKKKPDGTVVAPELLYKADAKALSPCGWVGQNMLYQKFVVMDIDGRGHGADDLEVIAFGNQFKDITFSVEDPMKPGSFHLYFETNRLIPVKHFPWAKLDFMGNSVNAAVYFKNKKGNGMPLLKLDEDIWSCMMQYQMKRKGK